MLQEICSNPWHCSVGVSRSRKVKSVQPLPAVSNLLWGLWWNNLCRLVVRFKVSFADGIAHIRKCGVCARGVCKCGWLSIGVYWSVFTCDFVCVCVCVCVCVLVLACVSGNTLSALCFRVRWSNWKSRTKSIRLLLCVSVLVQLFTYLARSVCICFSLDCSCKECVRSVYYRVIIALVCLRYVLILW